MGLINDTVRVFLKTDVFAHEEERKYKVAADLCATAGLVWSAEELLQLVKRVHDYGDVHGHTHPLVALDAMVTERVRHIDNKDNIERTMKDVYSALFELECACGVDVEIP